MKTFYLLACFLFPFLAAATTVHVPAEQPTIQAGIDAATDGDTVLVADGVYSGVGNVNLNLAGKGLTLRSENGRSATMLEFGSQPGFIDTLVSASEIRITGFTLRMAKRDNGGAVFVEGGTIRLDSCTFDRCTALSGGAVWVRNGDIKLRDCLFLHCGSSYKSMYQKGGAIFADSSNLAASACVFDSNLIYTLSGSYGGAIYVGKGSIAKIDSSTFTHNQLVEQDYSGIRFGGALFADTASVVRINECRFEENAAYWGTGEAVFANACSLFVARSSFIKNCYLDEYWPARSAVSGADGASLYAWPKYSRSGGAIYACESFANISGTLFASNGRPPSGLQVRYGGAVVADRSIMKVAGCTFVDNHAYRAGSSIFAGFSRLTIDSSIIACHTDTSQVVATDTLGDTSLSVSCTDVYGNAGGDWIGCIDSLAGKYNNFSLDPKFCRKSQSNYNLQESSPCRPAGNACNSLIGALPVQAGCNSCCEATTGNVNMVGIVDLADLSMLIASLTVLPKPYPLPCPEEANVNTVGIIDLSDLSLLIAYLTQPPATVKLPWCL